MIIFLTSQNYNHFQCGIFIDITTKCQWLTHIFTSSPRKCYKLHEIAYSLWCSSVPTINKIIFVCEQSHIESKYATVL